MNVNRETRVSSRTRKKEKKKKKERKIGILGQLLPSIKIPRNHNHNPFGSIPLPTRMPLKTQRGRKTFRAPRAVDVKH